MSKSQESIDKFDKWFLIITVGVLVILFVGFIVYAGVSMGQVIEAQGKIVGDKTNE